MRSQSLYFELDQKCCGIEQVEINAKIYEQRIESDADAGLTNQQLPK